MSNPITSYGSPEIPLAGPRSALATATGLSTTAANALAAHQAATTSAHDALAAIAAEAEKTFGTRALFGIQSPLSLICTKGRTADLAAWLIAKGAAHVSVAQMDYIFSAQNALYDGLMAKLG
jgi:ATP phosphoribosyltransferase